MSVAKMKVRDAPSSEIVICSGCGAGAVEKTTLGGDAVGAVVTRIEGDTDGVASADVSDCPAG